VDWAMKEKNYSQRRACYLAGIVPRLYRYRFRRGDDGELRCRLRKLGARAETFWLSSSALSY